MSALKFIHMFEINDLLKCRKALYSSGYVNYSAAGGRKQPRLKKRYPDLLFFILYRP